MARPHKLPAFPSSCDIYRGGPPGIGTLIRSVIAEKVISVRGSYWHLTGIPIDAFPVMVDIYLPTGTDVRGRKQAGGPDYLQWGGNPIWIYLVEYVDHIAEGFPNQFTCCFCTPYTVPTPFP